MTDIVFQREEGISVKAKFSNPPYSVSFLRIQADGDRLRVIPTRIGKRKLPRFWTVWLEDLILRKTQPEQGFSVSIDNHHVLVGAEGVTREGLMHTTQNLVAQLHQIGVLPLKRVDGRHHGMGRAYEWELVVDDGVDVPGIQALLPKSARLSIELDGRLKLLCSGDLPTAQHIRLMVEYRAAQSFAAAFHQERSTMLSALEGEVRYVPTSLKVVVELDGDDVIKFLELVRTDDKFFQSEVARAVLLGACERVVPAEVKSDISVLLELRHFVNSKVSLPPQTVADLLSYERGQLAQPATRLAIKRWVGTFSGALDGLERGLDSSEFSLYEWVRLSTITEVLVDGIKEVVRRSLNN